MQYGGMRFIISIVTPTLLLSGLCHGQVTNEQQKAPKPVPTLVSKTSKLQIHELADLKRFQMGVIEFKDLDITESVELLKSNYEAICKETLETPHSLGFIFNEDINKRKVSITLGGSFIDIINQLTAIHDTQYERNDSVFTFSYLPISPEDNEVVTRIFKLPPEVFNKKDNSLYGNPIKIIANDPKMTLKWNPETSTLNAHGQQSAINRLNRYINNRLALTPIQCRITTKAFSFNPDLIKNDPIIEKIKTLSPFSEGEAQLLTRKLSQLKGSDIVTYPSVVARFNEKGTIEIIKEIPSLNSFIGFKQTHYMNSLSGLCISSALELNYHFIAGMKITNPDHLPEIDAKPVDLKKYQTKLKSIGRDGSTHVFKLDIPDSDQEHLLLMKMSIIDASGRPIKQY